jgi:hypothetical protein
MMKKIRLFPMPASGSRGKEDIEMFGSPEKPGEIIVSKGEKQLY